MIVVVTRIREKKKREKETLIILRTQSTSLNSEEIHSTQNVLIDIQFTSPVIPIRCNYRSLRSLATLRSTVPSSLSLSLSLFLPFSIGTSNAYQEINFSACVTRRPQKERGVSRSQSLHKNLIIRLSGRRKTTEPRPR